MADHLLITAEAIPAKVCRGFASGIAQNKKRNGDRLPADCDANL